MLYEVIVIYLGGWVIAALALYAAGRRFAFELDPGPHPVVVSILAGAVWPLLIIGLAELSSIAVATKVHPKEEASVGIFA
jgi:hypothetical protein